eukprot:Hpha_TRINITY_DN12865_c0_g2::TRINITY_DN12865_c0_g2_i2::g.24118::m.24118
MNDIIPPPPSPTSIPLPPVGPLPLDPAPILVPLQSLTPQAHAPLPTACIGFYPPPAPPPPPPSMFICGIRALLHPTLCAHLRHELQETGVSIVTEGEGGTRGSGCEWGESGRDGGSKEGRKVFFFKKMNIPKRGLESKKETHRRGGREG